MSENAIGASVDEIENPAFREYALMYADIERDFKDSVRAFGLDFAKGSEDVTRGELARRVDALAQRGAYVENDRKSIHLNHISPACVTCRRGVGSETFLVSTQCPWNCFYCFNPNQERYEFFLSHERDVVAELRARHDAGIVFQDLALTGGEPLLHPDLAVSFFECARDLYPNAHTRLYTSGWGLDDSLIRKLQRASLSEIRFSVKLDEGQGSVEEALRQMQLCLGRIPSVMVEMPVMPDSVPQMKALLVRLDEIGIQGINLLELCFPLHNAPDFAERGYLLKASPYRVLYDYHYAGGLPIDGSESACVELLEFAVDAGLRLGVHYCSLENKLTGQVYQQNRYLGKPRPWHVMSERDYFFRCARVFGRDIEPVETALTALGVSQMHLDVDRRSLEFPLSAIPYLASDFPDLEVGVCLSIAEQREQGILQRELAIRKTTPATFDIRNDF